MSENETHLPEDPAEFNLDDWLATGTVARRYVSHYADQAAAQRMVEIDTRLRELGVGDDGKADSPLDGGDIAEEIAALEAEAEEILDRVEASKSIWEVRGLSAEEVEQVARDVPGAKPIPPLPANASENQRAKWQNRVIAATEENARAEVERRLQHLALAVVSVTRADGAIAHGVSLDTLRALRARVGGQQFLNRLYAAADKATADNVEIPRPTSPRPSTPDVLG